MMLHSETKSLFDPSKTQFDQNVRLHELDGLRGWAALCVVAFHMIWETFGAIHPELRNPITAVLLNSSLAVSVFFVLSGEALSSAHFSGKGSLATVKLAIKRYPRLVIPIFATALIVFLLSVGGLLYNIQAASIVNRMDWLGKAPVSGMTLVSVIKYSFFSVFLNEFPQNMVVLFLWTMRIELVGSVLVFITILFLNTQRNPKIIFATLLCLFVPLAVIPSATANQLSCFVVGMIFAHLRWNGGFRAMQAAVGDGLLWGVLGCMAIADGVIYYLDISVRTPLLAELLLLIVFMNGSACRLFSTPVSRLLGKLSFPLYLVQFPILVSFTSWAIVTFAHDGQIELTICLIIALASIGLSLMAAWLFLPVETFTRFIGNRLVAIVLPLLRLKRFALQQ